MQWLSKLIKRGPSLCDLYSSRPAGSLGTRLSTSVWTDTLNYTQKREIRMEKDQATEAGTVHLHRKKTTMVSKCLYWQKGEDCSS